MRTSYLIRQGLQELKKKRSSYVVLILCMASCFLAFGCFALITLNLRAGEQKLRSRVEIEVYLNDDITSLELHSLIQKMRRSPEVEKAKYRSKREALNQMEDYLGEDVSEGLDTSPLPASFLVSLKEEHRRFDRVARVAFRLQKEKGVEEVVFGESYLKKLDRAISTFLIIDLILGICMALAVIMMVTNLARSVVRTRAESIRTMSLLGASGADISLPLLMQGIALGGLGALLGTSFLWAGYLIFTSHFSGINFLPAHLVWAMIVWGMVLGAGGSLIPARRLLRSRC